MSVEEQRQIKLDFYDVSPLHFPGVIGAVDGSLIPILAPTEDEHLYVGRKGYHALNIQGIAAADLKFLNIVARWPGSTHDSFIWLGCNLENRFENGQFPNCYLLGDSAYGLKQYLMTPIRNPETRAERKYNRCHRTTRCVVERAFGVWKMRFRCLHKSGGTILQTPLKSIKIILATAALHNICIEQNLPLPDEDAIDDDDDSSDDDGNNTENGIPFQQDRTGAEERQRLVDTVFAHR